MSNIANYSVNSKTTSFVISRGVREALESDEREAEWYHPINEILQYFVRRSDPLWEAQRVETVVLSVGPQFELAQLPEHNLQVATELPSDPGKLQTSPSSIR
jgi:hypothetical protein